MSLDLYFLCIGATKCGTTWLHSVLNKHPQINASMNKEPCYFSHNYIKGVQWYEKCWSKKPGIKGEFTNHYIYKIKSLKRIKNDFPNIKLIILLRNPRDRAISHYKMIKKSSPYIDGVKLLDLYPKIIERSYYYTHLEKVFDLFNKNNIFIGYYDEITNNPEYLLSNILKFLSINENIIPNNVFNVIGDSYKPKYYFIENIRVFIHDLLIHLEMYKFIVLIKRLKIYKFLKLYNKDNISSIYIPLTMFNIYNKSLVNDLKKLDQFDNINSNYIHKWIYSIYESEK